MTILNWEKAYYATCVTPENNWLPTKIIFTLLTELECHLRLL
jgi:hypothetical protein